MGGGLRRGLRAAAQRFINPWNSADHDYNQPQTTERQAGRLALKQPKWVHLFEDICRTFDGGQMSPKYEGAQRMQLWSVGGTLYSIDATHTFLLQIVNKSVVNA